MIILLSVYNGISKLVALTPDVDRCKTLYANGILAFDIETTRLDDDNAVMYIWQCGLYVDNEYYITYGRTWEEWTQLQEAINKRLGLVKIVCMVHNLSYEFQFLAGQYEMQDVFCLKARKILTASCGCIEYRCSYIWTNKALNMFLRDMGVEHEKKSGADYDYAKKRYSWTEMTAAEIEYCQNDVIGLLEATVKKLKKDGDTVYTMPRTSTGYVRRDTRRALANVAIGYLKPTVDVYHKLRLAFRGGNTHANRFYVGKILKNVHSCDRCSSYPDVMLNQKYPMKPFRKVLDGYDTIKRAMRVGLAILCTMAIEGAELRNKQWGAPYIPVSKCTYLENAVEDNGRVLSADMLVIEVTDVDIEIIMDEYTGAIDFYDIYTADKDYLPNEYRELVRKYYTAKTKLKGVEGEEYEYIKSKNLLNSLYGMCATDPGKDDIIFDAGVFKQVDVDVEKNIKKALMPYQWGVWVTAYARRELEEMIKIAGSKFVYADTDSCKYIADASIDFSAYNDRCKTASSASGAYAEDPKGERHYMGVAEYEGQYYHFLTWGAKKYASEDENGKISITIAGVRKKSARNAKGEIVEMGGADELEATGGLKAFKPGYIFRESGGLESIYNDTSDYWTTIDGHELHVTRNVCLRPSNYTVSLGEKYHSLIADINNTLITIDTDRAICYNLYRR